MLLVPVVLVLLTNTLFALFWDPHSSQDLVATPVPYSAPPHLSTANPSTENQTVFKDLPLSGNNGVAQDLPAPSQGWSEQALGKPPLPGLTQP